MLCQVYVNKERNFTWIDAISPTDQEIEDLVINYHLPRELVNDALEPDHLPKFEQIDDLAFLILRGHDDTVEVPDEIRVNALTRKLAFFIHKNFLITIHRSEQNHVSKVKEIYSHTIDNFKSHKLVAKLIRETVLTYDKPIVRIFANFEMLENKVQEKSADSDILEECFLIRRESSIYKRMLRMSIDVISKLSISDTLPKSLTQDLREEAEDAFFYVEDLVDNTNQLMNLHMSLTSQETNEASFKTNEVMRVLTVLSLFFLPLNLIVGIYGMNFKYMPELETQYGYFFVLGFMALVATGIYLWFRRKGWMKDD